MLAVGTKVKIKLDADFIQMNFGLGRHTAQQIASGERLGTIVEAPSQHAEFAYGVQFKEHDDRPAIDDVFELALDEVEEIPYKD